MEQLNYNEIIEYAEKLELESYYFYRNAIDFISDLPAKELILKLSVEEIIHYNRLKKLSENKEGCEWKSDRNIQVKTTLLNDLSAENIIDSISNFNQIVQIALKKEKNAEELYSVLLSLTDLDADAYQLFSDLKDQEKKHAEIIEKMIIEVSK